MSDKEDKLREELERKIERQIDESRKERREDSSRNYNTLLDITKMQSPGQWPDPPKEKKESDNE